MYSIYCIKQHLKIKAFYGNSENAEYTQIWIAVYKYLLLAIAKKRWQVEESLFAPESVADFVRNSQLFEVSE